MWEKLKLSDVCSIINGGTPDSKNRKYWNGDIEWITPKDMGKLESKYTYKTERKLSLDGLQNSSAKLIPENSIIISCRAPIGHVAINKKPMSFNQGCKGLIPNKKIITEFLYYFLIHSKDLLNRLGKGTTFKEISAKKLSGVSISVPSIDEQKKLVSKIDLALNEGDKLKEINNIKYNQIKKFIAKSQNSLFEKISSSCDKKKLLEVVVFENGDRGKNYPSRKYQSSEGIPFVNAGDFSIDGDITKQSMVYISEERFNLLGAGKFKLNDILFCLRGSLGKSAINKTLDKGAIASSLVIMRAIKEKILPDYLFAYLRSDIVKNLISKTAGGTAQPNLSAKTVMNYKIPVPSINQQKIISDKFWKIRKEGLISLRHINEIKKQVVSLKLSIISKNLKEVF